MTKEEVKCAVNNHNYEIDKFIEMDLPKLLKKEGFKVKDGVVLYDGARAWFTSQRLIKEKNFYEKGMEILRKCRNDGWDVKIDGQSDKLVWYGGRI